MILIVDAFFTGSHRHWGEQLKAQLPYEVELLTLSGKNWKWRMQGGAIELAQKFKKLDKKPSLIIATDMVNLPLFYAYSGITIEEIPCLLYFHENQFAYPISEQDTDKQAGRENHYAFINLSSAFFATKTVFNSNFNKTSFLKGAEKLISALPNNNFKTNNINNTVIYPGVKTLTQPNKTSLTPVILWNHRWEHDKNPELFLEGLRNLKSKKIDFKLIVLGKGTEKENVKTIFNREFKTELIHCGFVEQKEKYWELIAQANLLPVTSKHDFFGLSVAEAMQLGAFALLPNHQAYPEHLENNNESGTLYEFPTRFISTLEEACSSIKQGKMNPIFEFDSVITKWDKIITETLNN